MPRLSVVDPATTTGQVREIFDGPLKGKHLNIFKGLANSPAALQAYLGLSGALKDGLLTAAEREIIALQLGQSNDCGYCVAAHTVLGKMAGLSEAQTVEARLGKPSDGRHAALARFVTALSEKRGFVDDAEIQTFREAGFSDGHVVEVVANFALNTMTNYFNHVNDTEIDFPAPPALN